VNLHQQKWPPNMQIWSHYVLETLSWSPPGHVPAPYLLYAGVPLLVLWTLPHLFSDAALLIGHILFHPLTAVGLVLCPALFPFIWS
jgi:hypothetical protein